MTEILSAIGAKIGWIGLGVLLPLIVVAAKKFIPQYFGKMFAGALGKGMSNIDDIKDPIERQLVKNIGLAVVKWAEYKIPDKGMGKERYRIAAEKLCSIFPFLKGQDKAIEDIIEASVVAMDNELKKVSNP